MKTKTNLSLADKKEIKTRVVLPYVPRYFEALSKILRNVGILVSSKPYLTLKDILPKAKDSVERSCRPGVVYQISCRDCTGIYIGETGRAYKTRLAEHKRDLKPANLAKVDDNNFNKKWHWLSMSSPKITELTGIIAMVTISGKAKNGTLDGHFAPGQKYMGFSIIFRTKAGRSN